MKRPFCHQRGTCLGTPLSADLKYEPTGVAMDVPLLARREIEARIVKPILEAFSQEFGRDRVVELVKPVIRQLALEQGAILAESFGDRSLAALGRVLEMWKQGGALEIEVIEQSEHCLSFNVTRCRYAELYRDLGMEDLGPILSCSRDFALVEGFNPDISLTRTQTIMEGAEFCGYLFEEKSG